MLDPSLEQHSDFDTVMVQLRTAGGKQCQINNCREAVYGYDSAGKAGTGYLRIARFQVDYT